jgi:glycine dehydrogenase subunit 1
MPFIPHTEEDTREMLATIGVKSIDELFDEIPSDLLVESLDGVPDALNEMQIGRLMRDRAARDAGNLCFIGAGAYEHHIPAAIWEIVTRGEFYSAYTPYQAEASQGTLQVIYEFQSMMAALTGLDVSNASLYDGGSAVAEAVLMAVRANRKSRSRRVLMLGGVTPAYRRVAQNITGTQGLELELVPVDLASGRTPAEALAPWAGEDVTAVVVQQPNFFGQLEDVDAITRWAHAQGALLIGVVNPTSLALIEPPGSWGEAGADIACGEGQPLGVPLSGGGPYFGFMTCTKPHVRQLPGRIVGRTVDLDGQDGFTLTLQAREQHIRRSKATSNICTNQGLMVTAATIYLSLLGAEGLGRVAAHSMANCDRLVRALTKVSGVSLVFDGPRFHEAVLRLDRPVQPVLAALAKRGIAGGYALSREYPDLGEAFLVCATEVRTDEEIAAYASALEDILRHAQVA